MIEQAVERETSFDALFEAHYRRLVRHLSVVAGSREVAEDAVQEALARAYVRWDRLCNYEDPAGWVRRVALNRIHNHHRGLRRFLGVRDRLASTSASSSGAFDRWVDREEVARALSTLSSRQRETVVLFYLEGLSVVAVASEMGISEGTVKTHLYRAREALRPLLEEVV